MRAWITRLPQIRRNPSRLFLVALLVIAIVAGKNEMVTVLRGGPWIEDEPGELRTHGYYEDLLNEPRASDRRTAEAADPPPGARPFRESGIVDETASYLRWRMRPNLDIVWNGATFRTNSLGFRTPEFEPEKPEGTYRIVLFGSSNTMGHGVDDDEPYPRHLERWLSGRVGPSRRVEVVNLSVSGDSPTRRLQRLREEGGRFDPDWLLCDASVLDFWLEEAHLQTVLVRGTPIPFAFVRESLRRAGVAPTDPRAAFLRKIQGERRWLLDGAFAGWGAEARRLGAPMTVVILPRSDSNDDLPDMLRLIRSLCGRHGLDYLDLSDAFGEIAKDRIQVSQSDKHPNALGHFLIFEALRDALKHRGGPPGLPLSRPGML